MKRAVILLNLGGPLKQGDIRPFLFNFFMDKNIISAPLPVRFLIAMWISITRSRGAAKTAYAQLGYKSPLLENTQKQAAALEKKLENSKVFIAMRYWHPRADETARLVKEYDPDEIVLIPLYPQFSTTTVKSSLEDWARACDFKKPTRTICCWPENAGFIEASADNIQKEIAKAPPDTRVLFSAHGLPEKIIKAGDPYQKQCEITAQAIAQKLDLKDWQLCYQSRVGRLKWIGPSTEEALHEAARDKRGVIVYPLAFVSEHVETLVEIDMDYRRMAGAMGIPYFAKAETAGTHPAFIDALAGLVTSGNQKKICAAGSECCGYKAA